MKRPRPRRQEGYGTLSRHVPGLDLPVYVVVGEAGLSIGLIAEHTSHLQTSPKRAHPSNVNLAQPCLPLPIS